VKKPGKVVGKIGPSRTAQRPSKLANFDDGNQPVSREGISRVGTSDLAQFNGVTFTDFANTVGQAVSEVEASKNFIAALQAEGNLTPKYQAMWASWVQSAGVMLNALADELEAHPDVLSNIARVETLRALSITQTSEILIALRGQAAGYYAAGDLENPDKVIQIGVIIAIIAAIVAIAAIFIVSQETIQMLIDHTNASARLAMVNACLSRSRTPEERRQCVQAAATTAPKEKAFPWVWLGLGAVAIGAGYWYFKKYRGLSEMDDFEDAP